MEIPVIMTEELGFSRNNEPVTVGIPLTQGLLNHQAVELHDPDGAVIPVQTETLAYWPDGSSKWLLLDFQATVAANSQRELLLTFRKSTGDDSTTLVIEDSADEITVDTGSTRFTVSTTELKPFSKVICQGRDCLSPFGSSINLSQCGAIGLHPVIDSWSWEARGPLRSTLLLQGFFPASNQGKCPRFFSRLTFYASQSFCKIDFTLWNPHAAKHPGGLWDLGDKGSILFEDLSVKFFPAENDLIESFLQEDFTSDSQSTTEQMLIYQDSSGGDNWQSSNHLNRDNKVCTTFRGYKVFSGETEISSGNRATPSLGVQSEDVGIEVVIKEFWQNFPKSLSAGGDSLTVGLFPNQYNDQFELQGGERKTHTFFVNFSQSKPFNHSLQWVHSPLHVRLSPEDYAVSRAVPWLLPQSADEQVEFQALLSPAVMGNNTFFDRREIIDEYGWRNFGEWYADHESVGQPADKPFISHYNNQYDGILGALYQYLKSGDKSWFLLADQLDRHSRDIDIYHTAEDRPEYNSGLFWHTEHYIDARTASHRCFSKRHADLRNLSHYGGGPALDHNYIAGFLYHFYLTGEHASKEAVLELTDYNVHSLAMMGTLSSFLVGVLRKAKGLVSAKLKGQPLVDFNKVFGTDGPGRGSGNALSSLMTGYELTGDDKYLSIAENLICTCVHPGDELEKMDMLDAENRWMYTVFLQALCKYLDIKRVKDQCDKPFEYGRQCLLHYAFWMVDNEYLYLDKPEKLEFPNETWAAQEIRKCNVLLYAALYCSPHDRELFRSKAQFFYQGMVKQMQGFETREHTRPIAILLQNSLMYPYFSASDDSQIPWFEGGGGVVKYKKNTSWKKLLTQLTIIIRTFSIENEFKFIKWRLKK